VATTLIFIPAAEYEAVSREQAPHAAEALETAEVVRLLERVPIFANMPRNTLRHLAHMIERKQVPPKTIIVRQGRPSGMFYVIQHGQAAVLIRNTPETTSLTQNLAEAATKSHRVVATIGSKEFFGELELLRGTPPVASIVTITEATLLALPHEAIRAILTGEQRVVRSLEQIGSDRLIALRGASS
jgi:putative peptide zinc metalloprotease protein